MTYFHGHQRADDDPCEPMPPPGVTLDQLNFFTEQTDRAVRKSLRIFSRRAVAGFIVLFVAAIGNVWFASRVSHNAREAVIKSGDAVAISGCNRDFRTIETLRVLLKTAAAASASQEKKGEISHERGAAAKQFYVSQLKALKLPDCRKSDDILTDNPNKQVAVPEPLYPGSTTADPKAG